MKKSQYLRKNRQLKKKKPILRNRFFWIFVLISLLSGTAIYFTIFSPTFQVKEIKISGVQKLRAEDLQNTIQRPIEKKIAIFPTKSIFLINLGEIKGTLLKEFARLEKVDLKRILPATLIIQIQERQPVGVWCKESSCFLIDKNGIIFEESSMGDGLVIWSNKNENVILGQKVLDENLISSILMVKEKLSTNSKIEARDFIIVDNERLNVKTGEGWEAYFDPTKNMEWQLTELSLVLEKEIPFEKRGNLEYIDLRFSKVYYKYR